MTIGRELQMYRASFYRRSHQYSKGFHMRIIPRHLFDIISRATRREMPRIFTRLPARDSSSTWRRLLRALLPGVGSLELGAIASKSRFRVLSRAPTQFIRSPREPVYTTKGFQNPGEEWTIIALIWTSASRAVWDKFPSLFPKLVHKVETKPIPPAFISRLVDSALPVGRIKLLTEFVTDSWKGVTFLSE